MTEQNDFKIKELCWAKIKGYPWWPAIIRDIYNAGNNKLFFVLVIFVKGMALY